MTKNTLLEKGPKSSGMGRPPPSPPHSGNARRKTFFFIDVFPNVNSQSCKCLKHSIPGGVLQCLGEGHCCGQHLLWKGHCHGWEKNQLMNFFRSEVYIHRVWERDQNGSCRLCRFPWRTFWLVSRIQYHLLFGDPLLDTLHYLQEHSCKDNLKIGVVKQKLTQFQRNRKLGFGKYIFVSLLTQRVVERMIGWLTVGKLATSVFHCWRGEEHTLPHITAHTLPHITTHTLPHITTHTLPHITTHSYTHYYTHIHTSS